MTILPNSTLGSPGTNHHYMERCLAYPIMSPSLSTYSKTYRETSHEMSIMHTTL